MGPAGMYKFGPMALAQITWQDVQQLPDDGNRYEALEGEPYVTAPPSLRHQRISGRLEAGPLRSGRGLGEVLHAPVRVEFPDLSHADPFAGRGGMLTPRLGFGRREADRARAEEALRLCGSSAPIPDRGVVLFTVARDEQLRLPWFLEHYGRMGVAAIVAVDHASRDATPEILDRHSRVVRYRTEQGFEWQEAWLDALLHRHGQGRWCLVVDVDELFRYPRDHEVGLSELCAYLDAHDVTALQAVLLDMYGSKRFDACGYLPGTEPLIACPYFEAGPYEASRQWVPDHLRVSDELLDAAVYGGVRARAFDLPTVCISKYPLLRFGPGTYVGRGGHLVEGIRPSQLRASLLHFKFLQDFTARVRAAVREGQYSGASADYRKYADGLSLRGGIELAPGVSTRFRDTRQLLDLGIMRDTPVFNRWPPSAGVSRAPNGARWRRRPWTHPARRP